MIQREQHELSYFPIVTCIIVSIVPERPDVAIQSADSQSIKAIALISTRQRGSVVSRTTCTVVVGRFLASRKYSPHNAIEARPDR